MVPKIITKQKLETKLIVKQRKGVSEIIVTLILLSVTVIGAVLVFTAFGGTGINEQMGALTGVTDSGTRPSIKIVGHDTRDGTSLVGISGLDNTDDDQLTNADMIVLHIRNTGTEPFPIERVSINDISHGLDDSDAGSSITGNEPSSGTFKLIREESNIIRDGSSIFPGSEARLVIKLSNEFDSGGSEGPIDLKDHLRIIVYPIEGTEVFKVIQAGSLG